MQQQQLFSDIQAFLARQSQGNRADGPYVLPMENETEGLPISPGNWDVSETTSCSKTIVVER